MADAAEHTAGDAQEAPGAAQAPTAATEAARLFGAPAAAGDVPGASPVPEGYVEKYWQAAKGDVAEYARHLSQGYTHLNGQFTQATQRLGDDAPGETPELYWAEQAPEEWAAKYDRLDFGDVDAIRDIYRAAHAQGIGVKAARGLVEKYLEARQAAAPEVESDESRRSRVVHELGPQGAAMASAVSAWVSGQQFTAEEVAAMAPLAESAAGMKALFKLSRATLGAPPGAGGVQQAAEMERQQELAEVKKGLADPANLVDPKFIARYRALVRDGHTLDGAPVPMMR